MTSPGPDAPRPGVPGSVTAATVPGVGWSLVAGVGVHLFLALAGLVALRAGHQRWLLVVAAVLGLAGTPGS